MHTMEYDFGICLLLRSGKSNLTATASVSVLVNWYICCDFSKAMSLLCTSRNILRFLALAKQKFDRLLFLCIIFPGTFPVLWCLKPQVLDQSILLRLKNFISFFNYNVDSWWFSQTANNNFCYTLKVIWYMRKNMKLDIAINYVCCWLFFVVSTLKQALKGCPISWSIENTEIDITWISCDSLHA